MTELLKLVREINWSVSLGLIFSLAFHAPDFLGKWRCSHYLQIPDTSIPEQDTTVQKFGNMPVTMCGNIPGSGSAMKNIQGQNGFGVPCFNRCPLSRNGRKIRVLPGILVSYRCYSNRRYARAAGFAAYVASRARGPLLGMAISLATIILILFTVARSGARYCRGLIIMLGIYLTLALQARAMPAPRPR